MQELDPFIVDLEFLDALASASVVERGIKYFEEHRVFELGVDGERLAAQIEGSDPSAPYSLIIDASDGGFDIDCSCPFDWEPACKHAVAALLTHTHSMGADDPLETAAEQALKERRDKGRREVQVRHVSGAPDFGTWAAHSVTPTGGIRRDYRVLIRSLEHDINYCDCRDFAYNQLGTCKHIEAVRYKLRNSPAASAVTTSVVYVDWGQPDSPRVGLHRSVDVGPDLDRILEQHFDRRGLLRGELPSALATLERVTRGHAIEIGDDARALAAHAGTQAALAERGQRVEKALRRAGGRVPGLRATLLPYQVKGVAFLAGAERAMLADDMGLGKTMQAIAASLWLRENDGVERILVVCPASLKTQWAREIQRFSDATALPVFGGKAQREAQYSRRPAFTIVNYEQVLRDWQVLNRSVAPDVVILDEAQRIRNWRTRTATAVKMLESRFAFVLTGTPLENRLEDLYSLMQMVDQRRLGPLWRFQVDFLVKDEHGTAVAVRNLSKLRQRLQPVMLRRDRSLVADQLPPRLDHRIDTALSHRQQDIHDAALGQVHEFAQIRKRRRLTPSEENRLMSALQRARMACNAAGLVDGQTEGAPKLTELQRLLEELCVDGRHKIVIFSEWEKMTQMVQEVVTELELGSVRLHGGVPQASRGALIERFETDPAVRVFISTDAGSVGLNLQSASVLINLELPWNPAVLEQRIARIHRLGQKASTQVILMVAAGAFEGRVMATLWRKRALFDAVVVEKADAPDALSLTDRSLRELMDDLAEDTVGGDATTEGTADDTERDDTQPDDAAASEPHGGRSADAELADAAPRRPEIPHANIDNELGEVVGEVERALGGVLRRLLVTARGLVAVAEPLPVEAEALGIALSRSVPVLIVDPPTWAGLQRMGLMGDATPVPGRAPDGGADKPEPNPLLERARRKLRSAEVLVEADCGLECLEMAAGCLLAAGAALTDRRTVPGETELAAWLYAEAVPSGRLTPEDAAAILRADALSRSGAVAGALIGEVVEDARQLVSRLPQCAL